MKKRKLIKELKKSKKVTTVTGQHSEYLKSRLTEALNLIDVKKDKETWFRKMLKDIKCVSEERSEKIGLLENENTALHVSRGMLRNVIEGFKNDNTRLTLELRKKEETISAYEITTAELIEKNEELKANSVRLQALNNKLIQKD